MTIKFDNSAQYWEDRYKAGKWSGAGSYGRLGAFKAKILNGFVRKHEISKVIEFGCGDGNQLLMASYPKYFGIDVSQTAVDKCRAMFSGDDTKRFAVLSEYVGETAELALSLDVLYHLIEDDVFDAYMNRLLDAATRYVIVYSSNSNKLVDRNVHVRHREFLGWVKANRSDFELSERIGNPFHISK